MKWLPDLTTERQAEETGYTEGLNGRAIIWKRLMARLMTLVCLPRLESSGMSGCGLISEANTAGFIWNGRMGSVTE